MSNEGTWATDSEGNSFYIHYDEIDTSELPEIWQPIGGFCYPANIFARLPLPKTPFYIQDWLPRPGKMVFFGGAKAGKSYFSLQLARSIGAGVPFLGRQTSQGKVLYLQFELGLSILQKRMRDTKQDYSNVFVGTSFSMKLDANSGQRQLYDALDEIRPEVVILDPWYKIIQGDENSVQDTMVILNFLDQMIDHFGVSFVIIHHAGKDIERGGRGSSVLEGYPDSYIELRKVETGMRLTPKLLRHAELPSESIELKMVNFEFETTTPAPTAKDEIYYIIHARSEAGANTSPNDLGLVASKKTVYEALTDLQHEGRIAKVGRGEYAISEVQPQPEI